MGCCNDASIKTINNDKKKNNTITIPFSSFVPEIIADKLSKSIFRIEFQNKISTGFLMKMNLNTIQRYFIFTSANSISQEDIDSKITISLFNGKANKEIELKIKLDTDERLIKCFKDKEIDVTIIEILLEDNIQEDKYLYPDLNYDSGYNQYIGIQIYTSGYPCTEKHKSDKFFSSGNILTYKDKKNNIFYHDCAIENGSIGLPLVNFNNQVIGMHNGSMNKNSQNYGTFIGQIIKILIMVEDKINIKENKKINLEINNNCEETIQKKENDINNENIDNGENKNKYKINNIKNTEYDNIIHNKMINSNEDKISNEKEKKDDCDNGGGEEEKNNVDKENQNINSEIIDKLNNEKISINNSQLSKHEDDQKNDIKKDEIIDNNNIDTQEFNSNRLFNSGSPDLETMINDPSMADAVKCMISDPSIRQSFLNMPFMKVLTENNPMCKDIIEKQLEDLAPQINQEYLQNALKFMSNFGEDKIKEEIKNGNNDIKDSQNDNNNTNDDITNALNILFQNKNLINEAIKNMNVNFENNKELEKSKNDKNSFNNINLNELKDNNSNINNIFGNILINSNSNNIINKLNKSKDNNNFINNQSSNTIRDRNNYNIFSNFNENFGRQINPSINSIKKKENIFPKSKVKNDITTDININSSKEFNNNNNILNNNINAKENLNLKNIQEKEALEYNYDTNKYDDKLIQLKNMGFTNENSIKNALVIFKGNIDEVIDFLVKDDMEKSE